jgi:hypothetical protein
LADVSELTVGSIFHLPLKMEPSVSTKTSAKKNTDAGDLPKRKYTTKIKQSRNRPGVAQRVPGALGSQISMTLGTWRWWGGQPHGPAAFTPRMFVVLIFTRSWVDPRAMVRSEGICHWKIQWPLGIDPRTVRRLAQRLNHYATPGPKSYIMQHKIYKFVDHRYINYSV